MRRLILAALLAVTAVPALAQTPPPPPDARDDRRDARPDRGDGRPDNRDNRQDQRPVDRAPPAGPYNPGDRADPRHDDRGGYQDRRDQGGRSDYGNDRRDYGGGYGRDDRGGYGRDGGHGGGYGGGFRDDRRGYGPGDAYARFRGPQFYYPRGYGYRYYGVGAILPRVFFDTRFYLDPYAYRLPPAYGGTRWIRVGPDALLIRVYDGRVVRVIQGLFY